VTTDTGREETLLSNSLWFNKHEIRNSYNRRRICIHIGIECTHLCSHLLTYSMEQSPSWEADQFSQLTKKFLAFYETRRFFTVLTSARHLSLSWANSIQSPRHPPTSWKSISILSSHLRLGLPNGHIEAFFVLFCKFFLNLERLCGVMQKRSIGPFLGAFNLREKHLFFKIRLVRPSVGVY
jgi:hypothetical protein